MSVVRAVPNEECTGGLSCQHGIGFLPGHGAPVEAALLQLVERGEHHLILSLRGEGLVTVRQPHVGVQEAAAHCVVKLAVSYHGSAPALYAAWGGVLSTTHREEDDEGQTKVRRGHKEVSLSGD